MVDQSDAWRQRVASNPCADDSIIMWSPSWVGRAATRSHYGDESTAIGPTTWAARQTPLGGERCIVRRRVIVSASERRRSQPTASGLRSSEEESTVSAMRQVKFTWSSDRDAYRYLPALLADSWPLTPPPFFPWPPPIATQHRNEIQHGAPRRNAMTFLIIESSHGRQKLLHPAASNRIELRGSAHRWRVRLTTGKKNFFSFQHNNRKRGAHFYCLAFSQFGFEKKLLAVYK